MTILAEEASIYPADLFSPDWRPPDAEALWWVLHTRSQAEKAVARRLVSARTPFFLPIYQRRYRRQRREIRSYKPLFPGYVFILANEDERHAVLTTNLIANCLPVPDQKRLGSDLREVHSLIESGVPVSPEERLQPGMSAEIVGGPLKGYRGKVIRRGAGVRLVVEVDFLQSGASVEVDTACIRRL